MELWAALRMSLEEALIADSDFRDMEMVEVCWVRFEGLRLWVVDLSGYNGRIGGGYGA